MSSMSDRLRESAQALRYLVETQRLSTESVEVFMKCARQHDEAADLIDELVHRLSNTLEVFGDRMSEDWKSDTRRFLAKARGEKPSE